MSTPLSLNQIAVVVSSLLKSDDAKTILISFPKSTSSVSSNSTNSSIFSFASASQFCFFKYVWKYSHAFAKLIVEIIAAYRSACNSICAPVSSRFNSITTKFACLSIANKSIRRRLSSQSENSSEITRQSGAIISIFFLIASCKS
ncbi:hypothetical protein HmCmsJML164_04334 [Escherichia coli]|nr:hypothetical protein HmCmsJML164_04334 [Escherichia coli]